MSAWTDRILQEFPSDLSRFWIACDPDLVLLDEHVLQCLRDRGFELVLFDDAVLFRTDYEERYRAAWDEGVAPPSSALILHLSSDQISLLPWDYLQQARTVRLALSELFDKLSSSVVRQVGPMFYERLFEAQNLHASQSLGDASTSEFILMNIFNIAPALINEEVTFWREILRLHLRGWSLPPVLANRMATTLRSRSALSHLPIEKLVGDRAFALEVIQLAWLGYIQTYDIALEASNPREVGTGLSLAVPFDHPDIRMVVDSLFLDGCIEPVAVEELSPSAPAWVQIGIIKDAHGQSQSIARTAKALAEDLPGEDAHHREWLSFALRMGDILSKFFGLPSKFGEDISANIEGLQLSADEGFQRWLMRHFADLPSLPASKAPVMLHHVPRHLSYRRDQSGGKMALLLFDGLAIDQWHRIRRQLSERLSSIKISEGACFAWLPSLTSVSRQAAFSGLKPREFAETIESTAAEPRLWTKFWQDAGLHKSEIAYLKSIKRCEDLPRIAEVACDPNVKIAGIVVDMVDEMVHGATLGKRGIASQIDNWCDTEFVDQLIMLLLDQDFEIFLTSDHGNVDARGIGRMSPGVLSEIKGERVRVYRNALLASSVPADFDAFRFDLPGLPVDFLPFYPKGRGAFVGQGDRLVAHGGMTIEELIVPFVHITQKNSSNEK
ncbi:MAG: BREX-3 system phosphatase PglZ [Aquidulcibacter sp.]|nr:BREX-3 system phosphatase PglZ [Aquidulcibacter sp.]